MAACGESDYDTDAASDDLQTDRQHHESIVRDGGSVTLAVRRMGFVDLLSENSATTPKTDDGAIALRADAASRAVEISAIGDMLADGAIRQSTCADSPIGRIGADSSIGSPGADSPIGNTIADGSIGNPGASSPFGKSDSAGSPVDSRSNPAAVRGAHQRLSRPLLSTKRKTDRSYVFKLTSPTKMTLSRPNGRLSRPCRFLSDVPGQLPQVRSPTERPLMGASPQRQITPRANVNSAMSVDSPSPRPRKRLFATPLLQASVQRGPFSCGPRFNDFHHICMHRVRQPIDLTRTPPQNLNGEISILPSK